MLDLREEVWKDEKVNERVREAYWQLSTFDQVPAEDGKLVPMPVAIYNQMVDDLVQHELGNVHHCYRWLLRQIKHPANKWVLVAQIHNFRTKVKMIFDVVMEHLNSGDPRIAKDDKEVIEKFAASYRLN